MNQHAPAENSVWRTIFLGPNGLRAGWRLLIFYAIVFVLFSILVAALRVLHIGGVGVMQTVVTPFGIGSMEASILLFTGLAALIMAKIEHRKWRQYGLPFAGALGKDFWKGTVWGFVAVSGALLAIFALHGFRITSLAIHGTTILASTAAWSLAMLVVGLSEEFSFRGYAQFTLASGIGFWPAAFVLSGLFALAHLGNNGESISGLLSVSLFGLLFCLFLRRTGNLWFAVGFHAGWDWGQTFFYGVPDSGLLPYHNLLNSTFSGPHWLTGGTVGPEASIFTPISLLVTAIIFSLRYREVKWRGIGTPQSLTD
jgi:membrane protease YdiL (CAAX protease family)